MKSVVKSTFAVTALGLLIAFGCLTAIAFAEDYPYPNPRPMVATIPRHPQTVVPAANLAQWNGSFKDLTGVVRNFTMVGADPTKSNATTTVTAYLIPIKMVYGKNNGNRTFDPNKDKYPGWNVSVTKAILASPIFQSVVDFKQGGTDLGKTQYIDAFQRGNFWEYVRKNTNYHVLVKPKLLPEQTIDVSPSEGMVGKEWGWTVGLMDINAMDNILQTYIGKISQIQPNTLPIFFTHDIYLTSGGACCYGGYHSSNGGQPGGQTYIYASSIDFHKYQGKFVKGEDTVTFSHEIGEWMNDPFVDNNVGCQDNSILEVGDPLVLHDYEYLVNGFKYHLQDLVFLPYFGASKKTSLHGWYSFQRGDETHVCPGQ
jgi:hypothetical protein